MTKKLSRHAAAFFGVLCGLVIAVTTPAVAESLLIQSTTSTRNSGLFDFLLPKFTAQTGIDVRVVAVGTGQALKNARNGDGDVVLVHAKQAEEKFVADGFAEKRYDVMYNDFVIVGPKSDPADASASAAVLQALKKISQGKSPFVSRGDDSGTHKKERALWKQAGVNTAVPTARWYREAGAGMGATLNIAAGLNGYTITDRATWIAFKNKRDLKIVFEGDPRLFNQYGVMLVARKKHPHVNAKAGSMFIKWLTGKTGQAAIAGYKLDGQQLFFPNAKPAD